MTDAKKTAITTARLERLIVGLCDHDSGEVRLLAAVLALAVADATTRDRKHGPSSEKRRARDYFNRGGHRYLCELLGISEEAPRRWIARADKSKTYSDARP